MRAAPGKLVICPGVRTGGCIGSGWGVVRLSIPAAVAVCCKCCAAGGGIVRVLQGVKMPRRGDQGAGVAVIVAVVVEAGGGIALPSPEGRAADHRSGA